MTSFNLYRMLRLKGLSGSLHLFSLFFPPIFLTKAIKMGKNSLHLYFMENYILFFSFYFSSRNIYLYFSTSINQDALKGKEFWKLNLFTCTPIFRRFSWIKKAYQNASIRSFCSKIWWWWWWWTWSFERRKIESGDDRKKSIRHSNSNWIFELHLNFLLTKFSIHFTFFTFYNLLK